jgi:hypothetical protein
MQEFPSSATAHEFLPGPNGGAAAERIKRRTQADRLLVKSLTEKGGE